MSDSYGSIHRRFEESTTIDLDYTHVQDTFEAGKAELLDRLYLEYCRRTGRGLMHSYSRRDEE